MRTLLLTASLLLLPTGASANETRKLSSRATIVADPSSQLEALPRTQRSIDENLTRGHQLLLREGSLLMTVE
ncbi:MAG: hypothetical protein U1E22_08805, partial [Coriobacteriia bacterium]|nr:hypothetical protein [Coriobacteriia bacterium]